MSADFLLSRQAKIRRILIKILVVVAIHVAAIYAFMATTAKTKNNSRLVYTSIIAEPQVKLSTSYIVHPQAPCIAHKDVTILNPPPSCTEIRPLPAEYKILGEEDFIQIDFNLDANGRVHQPTVTRSSGLASLDQLALEQVRDTWIFEPCTQAAITDCARRIEFRWEP